MIDRWKASVCLVVLGLSGCVFSDESCVTKTGNPSSHCGHPGLPDVVADLARQCGIDVDCSGGGLAEGNASISGVTSVDGFFRTVLEVDTRATVLEASLARELDAIRAVFGVAPGADLAAALEARLAADLEGGLTLIAQSPRCAVDAQAVLEAGARCDASAEVGASVECGGACGVSVDADVDCGADGELSCTFVAADTACDGACNGTCATEPASPVACEGTCRGSCDGACDAFSGSEPGTCAGRCDGPCDGRCEVDLAAASCDGTCRGECTRLAPAGGCQGAMRARCEARGDGAVACEGRCDGEVVLPMAKAECQASVGAEAKLQVECSPPSVELDYRLRADLDSTAAAELDVALRSLERRLPLLLAQRARAELLMDASERLAAQAVGSVTGALDAVDAGGNVRLQFGLLCAASQAGSVPEVLASSASRLSATLTETIALSAAIGAP